MLPDPITSAAPDGAVAALPDSEQRLLFCMRLWVAQMKTGADHAAEIAEALDESGVAAAFSPLRRLMRTLSTHATRMIDVRCVCCEALAPDERALLDLLSHAQSLDHDQAEAILHRFSTPTGAAIALAAAQRIGTSLIRRGYVLPAASPYGNDAPASACLH